MSIEDIINTWHARLASDAKLCERLSGVVRLVVEGAGGGSWVVRSREPVGISAGGGAADCTVRLTREDLISIATAQANPQELFLKGSIKVEGDRNAALRFVHLWGVPV